MLFVNKLKVLTLMTCLVLVGQGFAAGDKCVDGSVWGGFTTKAANNVGDYYEVSSPEQLAWFACVTTHESGTYSKAEMKITQDIDLEGKLFIPISESPNGGVKFAGIIDGQGHTIRGLYIKGSEIIKPENGGAAGYAQNVGFVSVLGGGTIENLVLEVSEIYASSSAGGTGSQGSSTNPVSVGTLVGWMSGGTIKNCVVEGQITSSGSKNRVGGLAGNVWGATITDCVSNVSISASGTDTHVGGIVGALRNGNEVNLSSCVFEGDTLISVGGKVGGIVGYYEKSNVKTQNALYYSGNYPGVGQGKTVETHKNDDLNSEDVICALNMGSWNEETEACSDATSDVWSEGQSAISMNGSDGYKITFDANGGSFAAGAKKSKVVAKGAAITADEISIPIHADGAFAGWAVTSDATAPSANLGNASQNTKIYAVWKPVFNVTFSATPGVFPEGSVATKVVRVSQGDSVSIEGVNVPTSYEDANDGTFYFTGWAWESKKFSEEHRINSEDTIHLASIKPDKDTTIYAVWIAAKTVTVTYKANEHGKTRVEFMRVEAGAAVPQPENPIAYEGYTFVKWCTETPCVNKFEFDEPISDNIILYADWASERYAINYELAGGTNNAANPPNYTIDTTDITLAAPTRDGYTFDGWFYNHSVSDGIETFENLATQITSGSTGEITVYAKWIPVTYTIEYLSGNTISATVRSVEKMHDVDFTLSDSLDVFTHIGCTQGGWSKADYGKSGYQVDYEFGATYKANSSLILFPYWTCNEYGVTYDVNGGSSNHGNPATYRGPAALTLKEATWNQHIFAGWYKEANFQNKIEAVQDIDQDITLYAKWERKITYKPGAALSGSGAKELSEQVQWNVTYKFKSSIAKYARENYTLDGWATADGGEIVYGIGDDNNEGISLTLYPHWTAVSHTITYNNVETSELPEGYPETYTHENAVTLPIPSRNGYEFLGWYDNAQFEGDAVTGIPENQTEDKEFFAKWSDAVEYTATYNLNGGSMDGEESFTFTIESNDIDLATSTKNGYTFVGWLDGVTSDVVTVLPTGSFGDRTLTAQWSDPIEYTITYENVNGAANENATSYTIEQTVALNALEKDGFAFRGWFTNAQFEGNAATEISAGASGDTTFYAKWLEIFTITYAAGEGDGITGAVAAGTKTATEDATLSNDGFTREGYTQTGWKTEDGSVTYAMGATYTTDASVTLYPIWLKVYTITYELNGGTNAEGNPDSYTSEDLPITLLEPTKAGSKFEGWYYNSDFSGDRVDGIYTEGSDDNITLYAHWLEYPITVAQYGGVKILLNENGKTTAEIDGSSMETINIDKKIEVSSVSLDRVFPVGKYATIVLPFSIAVDNVQGGNFYSFTMEKDENGAWVAKKDAITDELEANTPYLIEATSAQLTFDGAVTLVPSDKMNDVVTVNSTGSSWTFKGTYQYHKWVDGDDELGSAYGFVGQEKPGFLVGQFVKIGQNTWIRPMRGYLLYTSAAKNRRKMLAKSLNVARIVQDEEDLPDVIDVISPVEEDAVPEEIDIVSTENEGTTVVGSINTVTGEIKMFDRWYDMNGRRLNAKPTAKGIYYFNGKKVMVK